MLNFQAIKISRQQRQSQNKFLVLYFTHKTNVARRMRELSQIFTLFLIAQKIPT